jgi:hypothetical protein
MTVVVAWFGVHPSNVIPLGMRASGGNLLAKICCGDKIEEAAHV